MFGKNEIRKAVFFNSTPHGEGEELLVNSIFPTIQGEGPNAGLPAIFIRLTGCNLACHFCDTEFESGMMLTLKQIVSQVERYRSERLCNTHLVVITGGEPMRQQLIPLISVLARAGYHCQIETAGTLWLHAVFLDNNIGETNLEDLIMRKNVELVCSPKTPKLHHKIIEWCTHFKYIVRMGDIDPLDGLPEASTQTPGAIAPVWRPDNNIITVWLQPCTEYVEATKGVCREPEVDHAATRTNQKLAAELCMKHGYRLSLQMHRIVGLD